MEYVQCNFFLDLVKYVDHFFLDLVKKKRWNMFNVDNKKYCSV